MGAFSGRSAAAALGEQARGRLSGARGFPTLSWPERRITLPQELPCRPRGGLGPGPRAAIVLPASAAAAAAASSPPGTHTWPCLGSTLGFVRSSLRFCFIKDAPGFMPVSFHGLHGYRMDFSFMAAHSFLYRFLCSSLCPPCLADRTGRLWNAKDGERRLSK